VLQQRNLSVRGGTCDHRKYIPQLVGLVATGAIDPTEILTQTEPITGAIEAYETFDQRRRGWIKVELDPAKAS
jgi:threonine dehydrogenase-like Zn-dependent dehydrogenase